MDGGEQFAVDVELALVPGAVADSNGGRVSPALQVGQLPLGQIMFATDAEHDLEVPAPVERAGGGRGHVVEELIGFVGAGRHPERLDREGSVAHPGVAVVPIAGTALHLRQRGGRRRADGAGGCKGERLEHPSAVVHQVLPGTFVSLVQLRPRLPRRHGVLEAVDYLGLAPDPGCTGLVPASVVQGEACALAMVKLEPARDPRRVDGERGWRREDQHVGARRRGHPAVDSVEEGRVQPVPGGRGCSPRTTRLLLRRTPHVAAADAARRCRAGVPGCLLPWPGRR